MPDTYAEQSWSNNDPTTPISAARLLHMEDGINLAHDLLGALATVATTGVYADLTSKPVLATVATSGSYTDLTSKPTFATVATSGNYSDLTGKPTLSTVANTGSYTDLINQPTATTLGAVPTTRTINTYALSSNITLAKGDIGLNNVDNTADATKAVLSATKLFTARAINGVNFDGTAAITVADATKVPLTRTIAGVNLGADITAAAMLTALGISMLTLPIVVQWNGSSWGSYNTDATRVRLFYSQDDAAASAPTAYNAHDVWVGA